MSDNEEVAFCVNHPDVETRVRCSSCGKPICTQCMVFSPVGVKCRECARPVGRMVAGPRPIFYARALGYGLAASVAGGLALGVVSGAMRFGALWFALILGYVLGEAVSRGSGRNGGPVFQVIAGACGLLAFWIAGYLTGAGLLEVVIHGAPLFSSGDIVSVAFAAVGIIVAVVRLRE